jgi:MFS transporter, YNFM family, putative membrane transport protein
VSSRRWILLATVAAYLPSAALPVLAHRSDLPSGPVDPAVLVVPFSLAFAFAFPLWGRLADRTATMQVIRLALALMAGAGIAVALAPSTIALIGARALQGAAAAGVPPAAQAALAQGTAENQTGRAISPMMLAVALAVLGGPAVASAAGDAAGWTVTALIAGCALPLALLAVGRAWVTTSRPCSSGVRPNAAPYHNAAGVRAGWLVSACVLAGHWTVLTRIAQALGPDGLHASAAWLSVAPLTGALGLPLVMLAARASDRRGPRTPMIATLVAGALGFALAAGAASAAVFVAATGLGFAVYWAYLPVVAAQVQRSAGTAARGRAAGGLYASMWCSAAIAGALASLAPSWRVVLAGAALSWAAAAVVAATRFISANAPGRADAASAPIAP